MNNYFCYWYGETLSSDGRHDLAGVGMPVEFGPDFVVHPVLDAFCSPDAYPNLPKSVWPVGQKVDSGSSTDQRPQAVMNVLGYRMERERQGAGCGTDASLREGIT
jgi:hypothetical protein